MTQFFEVKSCVTVLGTQEVHKNTLPHIKEIRETRLLGLRGSPYHDRKHNGQAEIRDLFISVKLAILTTPPTGNTTLKKMSDSYWLYYTIPLLIIIVIKIIILIYYFWKQRQIKEYKRQRQAMRAQQFPQPFQQQQYGFQQFPQQQQFPGVHQQPGLQQQPQQGFSQNYYGPAPSYDNAAFSSQPPKY